jgi:hypothetical protein
MLFGLTGPGKLVRRAAVFAVLCGVLVAAADQVAAIADVNLGGVEFNPAVLAVVVSGAAIAFVGGILLKR